VHKVFVKHKVFAIMAGIISDISHFAGLNRVAMNPVIVGPPALSVPRAILQG
jgi:hypothetical protein